MVLEAAEQVRRVVAALLRQPHPVLACRVRLATGDAVSRRGPDDDPHRDEVVACAPEPFTGRRVVVLGAGNSAVQIAAGLAGRAQVTRAARHPVRFARQYTLGRDLRWWLKRTGIGTLPIGRFLRAAPSRPVIDAGRCRRAVAAGAGGMSPRTSPGLEAVRTLAPLVRRVST